MANIHTILFMAVIFHLAFGVSGEDTNYIIVPMNMSFLGGTVPHFLHIYMTGSRDTDVQITIPTTNFSERITLTAANDWTWKNEYVLDISKLSKSMEKGYHIKASEPLNIYVIRSVGLERQSLGSFLALPVNEESKSHFLSPYIRRSGCTGTGCTSPGFDTFYVVAAGARGATVDVSRYNISNGIPSNVLHRTLGPFEQLYQPITENSLDNGIGLEVNATDAVAVYAGNRRIDIPYGYYGTAINNYIQIPDVKTLQKEFIIGPFPGNHEPSGYSVLIVFVHEDTVAKVMVNIGTTITIQRSNHSCSCVTFSGGCTIHCSQPLTKGAYVEFTTNSPSQPIIVNCSKPCQTLALKHTQNTGSLRPLGFMSLSASPKLRSSELRTFVPDIGEKVTVPLSYINIAVPRSELHHVFVDGDSIMGSGNGISQYILGDWTVVIVPVFPRMHILQFRGGIPVAVHVHGAFARNCTSTVCYQISFGFPAIFQVTDEQTRAIPATTDTITTDARPSSVTLKSSSGTVITDTSPSRVQQTSPSVADPKEISQISDIDIVNLSLILLILVGVVAVVVYVCRKFGSNPKSSSVPEIRYDAGKSSITYQANTANGDGANRQKYVNRLSIELGREYAETENTEQEFYEQIPEDKYEKLRH